MRGSMPMKEGNGRKGWTFWQKRRVGRDAMLGAVLGAAQNWETA